MYFIIAILILVSLFYVYTGKDFDFFTKEKTYFLKAMLPYMIFVVHSHLLDWDFSKGFYIVALFFFMSGYGLETKRIVGGARSINNRFFLNVLRKLIIPLVVPIIIFLTLRLFNASFSVILNEDIRKYQLVTDIFLYTFTCHGKTLARRASSNQIHLTSQ